MRQKITYQSILLKIIIPIVKIDAPKLSKQATNIQFKGQTDRYIPLLHYAFKDCPSLAPQIDRARFSQKGDDKNHKRISLCNVYQ